MSNCIIYGLSSTEDGRIRYIGQTTQVAKARLAAHRSQAKRRPTYPVSRWIAKVEAAGYAVQIVVLDASAIWNETEVSFIKSYRDTGYDLLNLTKGGAGTLGSKNPKRGAMNKEPTHRACVAMAARQRKGRPGLPHSEATKAKLSALKLGKKHTLETRAKMSAAHKGHVVTAQTRAKMSKALLGRACTWNAKLSKAQAGIARGPLSATHKARISTALKGHGVSAETRAKISAARIGKALTPEHKAKVSAGNKGKTIPEDVRRKMSLGRMIAWAKKKAQLAQEATDGLHA